MTDAPEREQEPEQDQATGALLRRLREIEDQPLDARAPVYEHVHDALQSRLTGGDTRSER